MFRLLLNFIGTLIATALAQWLIKRMPQSLLENAVTGYLDSKIGSLLGLTEAQVDGFLLQWAVPIIIGILLIVIWHKVAVKVFYPRTIADEKTTSPTDSIFNKSLHAADSMAAFIASRDYFTIAQSACLLAGVEMRSHGITGIACAYLDDIKKMIRDGKIVPPKMNSMELMLVKMSRNAFANASGDNRYVIQDDVEISKDDLARIANKLGVVVNGLNDGKAT